MKLLSVKSKLNTSFSNLKCIYGGSFDPVHLQHEFIVKQLIDLGYETIIVIPTFKSNLKSTKYSYKFRLKMCKVAFEEFNQVIVSDIESKINSSLTFDVLDYFNFKYDLVIGSDQYLKLNSWYKSESIIKSTKLVVFNRKGFEVDKECIINCNVNDISSTKIRADETYLKENTSFKVYNLIKGVQNE